MSLFAGALAVVAWVDHAFLAGAVLSLGALALPLAALRECGRAQGEIESALRRLAASVVTDAGGEREGS